MAPATASATLDDSQRLLLLLSRGGPRTGPELATQLGWDAKRVANGLHHLTGCGLKVAVPAHHPRSYQLDPAIEALDPARILHWIGPAARTALSGLDLCFSLDSTNTRLKQLATQGVDTGHICLAEHQTAGRGRRGRHWVSPPATNLYLSLLWRYASPPDALGGLSLALGVAAARAIESCIGSQSSGNAPPAPTIKWPNDLVWRDHKLGGILVELLHRGSQGVDVIVGVGINTHLPATAAAAIEQRWTDLQRITGSPPPRNRLAGLLLEQLLPTLEQYGATGLDPWQSAFARRDALASRAVTLHLPDGSRHHGTARGIDRLGALRIETATGITTHQAGEVSVRLTP